ncbi:tRNA-dihydrouridine(47) synthase [NAD(P)(+)]-like [Gordionus sp. m RMFG-2023]|uniref:tRNA-dihydrouridine(47) synthase [NAD(P)(+)]-like n=1 Tax=Gordionus sp. m RMFG-2023 TaxID=3053472 RepID=UPI0031FC68B0
MEEMKNGRDENGTGEDKKENKHMKRRGQNKHRPVFKKQKCSLKLCPYIAKNKLCPYGKNLDIIDLVTNCHFEHNIDLFMNSKPMDIGDKCTAFETFGNCINSFTCRFASSHTKLNPNNTWENILDKEVWENNENLFHPLNRVEKSVLECLRKRKYNFSLSEVVTNILCNKSTDSNQKYKNAEELINEMNVKYPWITLNPLFLRNNIETPEINKEFKILKNLKESDFLPTQVINSDHEKYENNEIGNINVKISDRKMFRENIEKRSSELNDPRRAEYWNNNLYLAPLTTLGNLPFRRVCKSLGVDITCGEMALSSSLLKGNNSEWALIKRHHSEDKFGIQVCGCHVDSMSKVAQLISDLTLNSASLYSNDSTGNTLSPFSIDFLDINMGCPLDEICKKGAGASMLSRPDRTLQVSSAIRTILPPPVALTLKVRSGLKDQHPLAHGLIGKLASQTPSDVSMIAIHGRSKNQRYTKRADWNYIEQCVEESHSAMPIFGCGDVYSYQEYRERLDHTGVAGIMIGRGALIKPWIFTEIKEQREWDISANERFDIFKDFVKFGLQHWGSDTYGVETTRRFLLEWLSFTHRYVPLGIIETFKHSSYQSSQELIQKNTKPPDEDVIVSTSDYRIMKDCVLINQRPPLRSAMYGRNDLERLMSSPDSKDWIEISRMLLGPTPENFAFLPKHKSNSYDFNTSG